MHSQLESCNRHNRIAVMDGHAVILHTLGVHGVVLQTVVAFAASIEIALSLLCFINVICVYPHFIRGIIGILLTELKLGRVNPSIGMD